MVSRSSGYKSKKINKNRLTTALTRTGNYAALHCQPVMRRVGKYHGIWPVMIGIVIGFVFLDLAERLSFEWTKRRFGHIRIPKTDREIRYPLVGYDQGADRLFPDQGNNRPQGLQTGSDHVRIRFSQYPIRVGPGTQVVV